MSYIEAVLNVEKCSSLQAAREPARVHCEIERRKVYKCLVDPDVSF